MLLGAAIAAATLYLAGLFWLAAVRDRQPREENARGAGWVYGLSLAVYCTSWTFYGGVGTAASAGLEYLPIYLGPILVFTLGFGLVRRILAQSKAQHSTSIADFLSARYGKSAGVAAAVTVIATIGALPYMALQLRSLGASLMLLSPGLDSRIGAEELVAAMAAVMGLFAILFGSRRADTAGDNAGLVLTIAVEAGVKLVALVAVAGLAAVLLLDAPEPSVPAAPVFAAADLDARFAVLTLIAGAAALCLPRQFHMAFVEAPSERASPAMQWVFPAYLALTALVIVPIVLAGLAVLPPGTDPDTIVLALPMANGNDTLALLVFLGGFSAAAGMIVASSVALSTMITNDLVAPLAFRRAFDAPAERAGLARRLLTTRRVVVALLLAAAYLFYLALGAMANLASLGTIAFAAVAQFAPGLVFGMVSRAGNRAGMFAGLALGLAGWGGLLLLPLATGAPPVFAVHEDPLVSGVVLSLAANALAYWAGSAAFRPCLLDHAQAAAFVGTPSPGLRPRPATRMRIADLRALLAQFIGPERAEQALGPERRAGDPVDSEAIELAERAISGVVGTSSARMLVASWLQGEPISLPEVVAMFDETSRRLSFSGDLLQIAIENIETGIVLVDAEMRLVAWNSRYEAIFALPEDLVAVGTPIADLIRFNLRRGGDLPEGEIEAQVERRLAYMREGRHHRIEREQHDGRVLRIIGSPTPGGGYTTSYTDITADRRAEQALEEKVAERTRQLISANEALAAATRSKTRFLAAASHDLIQPLNAARLFASALGEEVAGRENLERLVADLDGAIASADRLIRALLDISKLDSGGIEPRLEPVALDEVFAEVEREFAVQAAAKGLTLGRVRTSAWAMTDRALLASILRNLVSNAVRYTTTGGVLLGVRRAGEAVRLCVHDTGRGIAEADLDAIFEEFNRGASRDREGLGLGLAIVRRATRLLGIEVETRSVPGRGSRFALHMPVLEWRAPQGAVPAGRPPGKLAEARVLVVDNDPAALSATAALLGKWGLEVVCASSREAALGTGVPDVVIMDYRLEQRDRGDAAYGALCERWGACPPAILLTAEASAETAAAAARMGAERLLKPSSPAALRALISTCLARRRAARGVQAVAGSVAG
ncbi:PAS-domain containing protein [Erythrobacter sp. HL-111]|uniref:hybrid sensor histidine kinase/response regulator n=1 Tax=Erythrobacter sp. HL-111 TaxID=1798193 RepID=UPI0006D99A3B|nr:PAS-domain containing protein [Erythrobacter sp. HL-111]KPP93864.1 MAG: bifunctional proline transporter / two component signal transduction system histidine kinase PrlS [Erythrobacteraceae bacterium HL-111]SDS36741.1 Na+/proline symporter [Erythrobacter sp. HL-111]